MQLSILFNQINKIFFLKNTIIFIALTLLFSCNDQGCIEADDYGNLESQTLLVYSNNNQTSCDYDSTKSFEDQASQVLRDCLTKSTQNITDSDQSVVTSTTGCSGFLALNNIKISELCRQQCINSCQLQATNSAISQPSWTATIPRSNNSSYGVNISPNSEITITAKGLVNLGKNIELPSQYVDVRSILPNSYSTSDFSSESILDINNGQSVSLKFAKDINTSIDNGVTRLDDVDFARRLVAYIIPHPNNYKYDYTKTNPFEASKDVPLMPRFNGWKCLYSTNNKLQSTCSNLDDNYTSDPSGIQAELFPNADNAKSSQSFNVGSDLKKITDYGGFIRWDNDNLNDKQYNPFAITHCRIDGVCIPEVNSDEGIIIGDISSGFSYVNNAGSAKEISFKLIDSFCSSLTLSKLSVYDQNNRLIYYVTNLAINNSDYSLKKIPLNQGYRLVIAPNTVSQNSYNCGKYLAMRMLKYHDIPINVSGFASFRIVDNNSNEPSKNPSCSIYGRIINPKGLHNVINDSSIIDNSDYQIVDAITSLTMPPPGSKANVEEAYFGAETLGQTGDYIRGGENCSVSAISDISNIYQSCLNARAPSCPVPTQNFNDKINLCSNGIGANGIDNSSITGAGSGGGGGGNIHGKSYAGNTSGYGKGADSGESYFSSYYNLASSTSTIASIVDNSSDKGQGGSGGFSGTDGVVKIYDCPEGGNCEPTIFNYNPTQPYYEFNVQPNKTYRYEITGGGGGGGGNSCNSALGGNAANALKFKGILNNIDSSKISRLKIYVGGAGDFGYSPCTKNFISTAIYNALTTPKPSLTLSAPTNEKISKIIFASYGFPKINTKILSKSSPAIINEFLENKFCHANISKSYIADNCIGRSSCTISLTDSTLISETSFCKDGNGSNGSDSNNSIETLGSGGGGGGGNGSGGISALPSIAGIIDGGVKGQAGKSGDSFYDEFYHSTPIPIASSANNKGTPSAIAGDGSATITPSGQTASSYSTPGSTSITYNSATQISYSIKGAGGGAGGDIDATKLGGNGANATQFSGTISVNAGDVLRIDVGEKGKQGASICNDIPKIIFKLENTLIDLVNFASSKVIVSAYYGSSQRNGEFSYAGNDYCPNIDVKSILNQNLTNSNYSISSENFLFTPLANNCASGNGSSASSITTLANSGINTEAGGGGGAGGGNGFGLSGFINAGAIQNNSSGEVGKSADSYINPFYHATPIATTATSALNGSNATNINALDGKATINISNAAGTPLINLSTPSTTSYQASTTIASGVNKIFYKISGAGGGKGGKLTLSQNAQSYGSDGAEFSGYLNVKEGDNVEVFVGKSGTNGLECQGDLVHNYGDEFAKFTINSSCPIAGFAFANYGQPNTDSLPYTANQSCSSDVLSNSNINSCIGKTNCSINVSNLTFGGDPCPPPPESNNYSRPPLDITANSPSYFEYGGLPGAGGGIPNFSEDDIKSGWVTFNERDNTYYNSIPRLALNYMEPSYVSFLSRTAIDNTFRLDGLDGSIKICTTALFTNCTSFTTPGVYEYYIGENSNLYFEIKGGDGGRGGSLPNSLQKYVTSSYGKYYYNGYGYTYSSSIFKGSINLPNYSIIYLYVGGGGKGGIYNTIIDNDKYLRIAGGKANKSSLYFLGVDGGGIAERNDTNNSGLAPGGAGGSASFITYKNYILFLASGGSGSQGDGVPYNGIYIHDINNIGSSSMVTRNIYNYINPAYGFNVNRNFPFNYNIKKLAVSYYCGYRSTKGIGGSVSSTSALLGTKNFLSGGDGSETSITSSCRAGGGGGGGGATMISINGEIVAIAGGGGGGGGNISSTTSISSATPNNIISNTLKITPVRNLVISYLDKIFEPSTSDLDQVVLGGSAGQAKMSTDYQRYCTKNAVGHGGGGGGATMISVNNRVIAIAGGGGGGAGASTTEQANKNAIDATSNLLADLKTGPFGKYLAIAIETKPGNSGVINPATQTSGNFLITNAPTNSVFNDIISATFNSSNSQCSTINSNFKSLVETNCISFNSCINTIALSSLTSASCLTPSASAKLSYHTPKQGFTPAKDNPILKGGDGGINPLDECAGGGGAGGGASAISVVSNNDFIKAKEHFIVIAGGGGGAGGASCNGINRVSENANISTALNNYLSNTALGKWLTLKVSFPRIAPRTSPEDYYEYDDFSIPDTDSNDPLKNLTVDSSYFTRITASELSNKKIFVRKGQFIRFSPNSWGGTWVTKNGLTRQCGIGMVMQIEPRPALICSGKRIQRILNPNCLQDIDPSSTTISTPNGCLPNNRSASDYCNNVEHSCGKECYKKINCTGISTDGLYQKIGCSISGEPDIAGSSCSQSTQVVSGVTKYFNTAQSCQDCNNKRLEAIQTPYYLSGNYDNCYDLEDYEGKISNIVLNKDSETGINNLINNRKLKYLSSFNGSYGNLENFITVSNNNYETKYPLSSSLKGRMRFLLVDGHDLNVPGVSTQTYENFYTNNTGVSTNLSPSISLNGRNGEWLQVKLCKESSDSSFDCKSLNIPSANDLSNNNSPTPSIVQINSMSQISFDSVNYSFDTKGTLIRNTNAISEIDCGSSSSYSSLAGSASSILDPARKITTEKGSKFYCHTDGTSENRLRLSFKIYDPEINDCNIETGTSTGTLNGVKMKNLKYNSGAAGMTNKTCSLAESNTNNCTKEFVCVDKYSNNSGIYEVKVKVKNNKGISQIVNNIVEPITFWMDGNPSSPNAEDRVGLVEKLYKSLISNSKYKLILTMSLVLFVMFYGLGYLMGVSELSQAQIVVRVFKIGFIYLFVGETGWIWFKTIFVNIFKDGIIQASFLMASAFDNSTQIDSAIKSGNYQSTAMLFDSVDNVISMIFSQAVNKKIWAFLFTGIFGWAYILVFYFSIINYIYALSNAVLIFITAQVMISILFIIGPLFFIFLLFNQTKDMFDNWLKSLVSYGLQIIFLITTLAFFNMLMVEVLKMALSYKVCWDDAWVINLGIRFTLTDFWTIPSLPPRTNMSEDILNTGSPDSIPSFFSILYIWVISSLTTKMIIFMTSAAGLISEGIKAGDIASGIKEMAGKAKDGLAGMAKNQIWDRTVGKALDKIDNKLFDSGKTAKNERASNKRQAAKDVENRSQLSKAADQAEKEYKQDPDNVKNLGNKTPEEQKKELQQVRKDAMYKRGEKLGLNKSDVDVLAKDTGLKYYGTNVFGALFQAGKQAVFRGGSLTNSLDDKAKTKLTRDEAFNAMKGMNEKDRENFAKKIEDGNVNVANKLLKRLRKNPLKVGLRRLNNMAFKLNDKINPLNTDFDKAAKELENEGKIIPNIMQLGRNDKERAMIRDRVKQNRDKEKTTVGKKNIADSLLKRVNKNLKKRIKKQKAKLQSLLAKNYNNPKLDELNDIVEKADLDDENGKDVMEEFSKIDNLRDDAKIDKFLEKDIVKKYRNDDGN